MFDYKSSTNGLTKQKVIYVGGADKEMQTAVLAAEEVKKRHAPQKIIGYVADWAQYERKFNLEAIDATAYTKIVYAFLGIVGDKGKEKSEVVEQSAKQFGFKEFEITPLDPWGDFQSAVSQRQVTMGWDDVLYGPMSPEVYAKLNPNNVRGLVGQVLALKTKNPQLKIGFSVGGWTLTEPFYRMANDRNHRNTFNQSVVNFIKKWGFDFIDIDWEYPGHGGENADLHRPYDGANLLALISELRHKMDSNGLKNIEISFAAGASRKHIEAIGKDNYNQLVSLPKVDVNLMTYDFWGSFENNLGHQTNLNSSSDTEHSVHEAVTLLQNYGVPLEKINIGVANYFRGKKGKIMRGGDPSSATDIENSDELLQEIDGIKWTKRDVFGSYEKNVVESYDLIENMAGSDMEGINGFQLYTDKSCDADYYYNPTTHLYYSGDTPRTGYNKAKYAKDCGLGGLIVWTIEQDHNGCMINAINDGLGNELSEKYSKKADREKLYKIENTGNNTTDEKDHLAPTCDDINVKIKLSVQSGSVLQLSECSCNKTKGDKLVYRWSIPEEITVKDKHAETLEFTAPKVSSPQKFIFSLVVTDTKSAVSENMSYTITVFPSVRSPSAIKPEVKQEVKNPEGYPVWQPERIYYGDAKFGEGKGECVSWQGKNYRAQWWVEGGKPGIHNAWVSIP
ncbi:glycosyl hydrolase family 18 protein [Serratia marcescens]|uniref:glycosyl hydrolase family 18 protein n=1 Tax=Serratia marcescens TaxID=615 RepID=UPI0006ED268B|nr:glycosyl hydrolase family 18 protein [Serratia marcescens]ALL39886.1 hypothetical protein AR325_24060 [Serratia marcescens]PHI54201.1 hypothetical protein B9T65_00005 [Serratia marcescens]UJA53686.1 glycosyl hydrolase family 18 protein [Serratia marcescens]